MSKEEERLYGVTAFHVGERHYTPRHSIFNDKIEVFTDGYGKITDITNREKLIRLSLPEDIEGISIDEIGEIAFKGSINLELLLLPKSIERIEKAAFMDCNKLRVAVLGNNVYEIGESAFENCSELDNIQLPYSLETIGSRAFYGCSSLKEINLRGNVTLGSMCFASCTSLDCVEAMELKVIPDGAFISSGLRTIKLSNKLERIGISSFSRCSHLDSIYYDGTLDEFRKIYFGMNWNKDIPNSCKLFVRDNTGAFYNAFDSKKEKKVNNKINTDIEKDLVLLGINDSNPSFNEIAKAYRDKVRKFHPDILAGLNLDPSYTEFASKQFRLYTEAYDRVREYYKKNKS